MLAVVLLWGMDTNVGGFDRTARLVVGPLLVLVGLAALFDVVSLGVAWIAWVALLIGVIFTATGLLNFCPINSLLGRNTARR
jgi:hypothetical protein